jgi:hypothetical protein
MWSGVDRVEKVRKVKIAESQSWDIGIPTKASWTAFRKLQQYHKENSWEKTEWRRPSASESEPQRPSRGRARRFHVSYSFTASTFSILRNELFAVK